MANTRVDPPRSSSAERAALALARFFVVAPLYPAGHERSRGVAEACLGELRAAAPGATRIDIGRLGLQIQAAPVPLEHPQVKRMHQDLASLGIARIELGEAATPADLHGFVNVLVDARRRFGAVQGLRQLELAGLPETVRVVQREFGRRTGDAASAATVNAAVERVLDGHEGMAAETKALLRGAMEKLFGDVVESLCDGRIARAPGQPFGRSLDEVLELGANALRSALEELTAAGGDLAEIQGLFGAAEKALAVANDRSSVEVLLSVLQSSSAELRQSTVPASEDASAYELTIEALQGGIVAYGGEHPALGKPSPPDRCEELSILFHVLLASPSDGVRLAAEERLGACLEKPLEAQERAFLEGALRGLASRERPAGLDAVLPATLRGLRKDGGAARLLESLSVSASPAQREALWPHLVDALLLGDSGGGAGAQQQLLARVAGSEDSLRGERIERLLGLEAVRTGCIAPELFLRPPPQLYSVFGALLARQVGGFAGALLAGFQRHLPPWPGSEALLTHREVTLACRALLIAVLHEGDVKRASPAVEQQARRTLAGALRALKRSELGAPWLPRAIASLGVIGTDDELPLLREIARGFRLWPWRRWPVACREAARSAQASLRPGRREGSHD